MQRQEEKVDMREAVDAGLVVIESSGKKPDKHDTSSSSGNYTTQVVDADIGPVNDEEPFAEVQLTALHNILANEQQLTKQSEPNYDTHLLETIDSNTLYINRIVYQRGGEIDQRCLLNAGLSQKRNKFQASFFILMTLDHSSSSLGPHCLMMSVHISSGLVLHIDDGIHCISKFPSIYIQLFWNTLTHDAKTGRSLLHDNIVPKPDLALELGKSISLTEAEEEAVAREVHATHARIVSESEPEPTQRRQSGIAFRDSFIVSKKRSSDSSKKLKGIQTLTPAEQEAADIMKALKESKKMSKRQPGTGGSNEGTGNILGVPDESTVVSRASSEGTGSKPGVPDEEKLILEWEADVVSEHFDRDDNAGDDNEETKPDPEEIYK
ncbi:hypothetical protein Tco_1080426 [Tanacetum coccineum]|uniref:Uncharacterized protein n=1 Tax=Tanacetum coccineum TaxID=301880 RepID=A0ABQ5HUN0_9ASTR